jgi:LPXTG-motif cell wall-anchored protein
VHDDSGRCLSTDTSGGGETAPVLLTDCADAISWQLVYDPTPSHRDFRFVTTDGYFLGLEDDADAEEGAEVLAVNPETDTSKHFQEWLFADAPPPSDPPTDPPTSTPPSSPAPSESPSVPAESESPKPTLPTTGAGVGIGIGAGIVALAGGAALVLWWQRRRVLRSEW